VLFTDGAKYVADTAGAYWLLDEIALAQTLKRVVGEEFQLWKLKVNLAENTATTSALNNIFIPQEQRVSAVSLNMNMPLFQGGLVASQTRQAEYDFQTSSQQMERVYRDVVVNANIYFNTINDGIAKVKADRQTIVSQQNSLDSVRAQFAVGTRTMTDVVLAQKYLFDAQRQHASDQYDLINAILSLKYYAGTLNVNDLEEINSWLETTRVAELAPGKANPLCRLNQNPKQIQAMKPLVKSVV